jgi:hypothetical protein
MTIKTLALISGCLAVCSAYGAEPVQLTDAQMDTVTAGSFVCPVITTDAVLNSPRGAAIGEGHYTIGGPDVTVPIHATNGDGTGTPPGPHSQPGDSDYTAIWYQ